MTGATGRLGRKATATGGVLLASVLAITLASCTGEPPDARSLVVETSDGVTYVRQTNGADSDDVRYEGFLTVGDDGCLYLEVVEGPSGLYRAVVPPGLEVTADSVRGNDGQKVRFEEPIHLAREYAPYFDEGVSGDDDACDESLELFGVSGPFRVAP
jgi:hypothetical protein